jgi:hypothetical protein
MWKRNFDWIPGATPGSTEGNPSPDFAGRPVWFYESTTGGPLGSSDVWYAQSPTLLVWDDGWFGAGGLWAGGDDVPPPIDPAGMNHVVRSDYFAFVPRIRFLNATAAPLELSINGKLLVAWNGSTDVATADVDVAIVTLDGAGNALDELFAETVSKPTPTPAAYETIALSIDVRTPTLAVGESLVLSARAQGSASTDSWIGLDDDLILTEIPCR